MSAVRITEACTQTITNLTAMHIAVQLLYMQHNNATRDTKYLCIKFIEFNNELHYYTFDFCSVNCRV